MMQSKQTKAATSRKVACLPIEKVHTFSINGKKSEGTLYDVKQFPPSKPGKTGFRLPDRPPTSRNFKRWFDYFVNYIGATVEQLNAWQFNLDEVRDKRKLLRDFIGRLDDLATVLQIGESHNPPKLLWPLSGVYVCDLEIAVGRSKYRLLLVASFETDPGYRVVTNCSIVLIEPAAYNQPGGLTTRPAKYVNWNSSSSSSLATSSSSNGLPKPGPGS